MPRGGGATLGALVFCALASAVGRAQADAAYDDASGLFIAPGYRMVIAHCTACHSAKLITQQGASYEGWREIILWMQEEQGLWPIAEAPLAKILDYLATHYGPDRPHWRPSSGGH